VGTPRIYRSALLPAPRPRRIIRAMDRVPLGRTPLAVSRLCLGTMQFGWTADEAASFAVLDAFTEAGGNFIDTADIYSYWLRGHRGGESEEIIGRWLKARGSRDRLVIATKVRGRMWPGPAGEGLGREHIIKSCEYSLKRLQIDTIDLYQFHWFDEAVPIEESLRAIEELMTSGKVRYVGASNYPPERLREALEVAAAAGLPPFVSLQPHYNLVHRAEYEAELHALCVGRGLAVMPYSPLAKGLLTGKYSKSGPKPSGSRSNGVKEYLKAGDAWPVVDALKEVSDALTTTPAAVALAWELAQPAVTAPIIGANSPAQLADLLPAARLSLSAEELALLAAASASFAR
jgi:aryl-alcohol dehydrogenase-like predicted oxidoreductase